MQITDFLAFGATVSDSSRNAGMSLQITWIADSESLGLFRAKEKILVPGSVDLLVM